MSDEIPCQKDPALKQRIDEYAEDLKTQGHLIGSHGLDEAEFYESGIFEGAIQRLRGQISASMGPKKAFVQHILNHMQDQGFISDWLEAGSQNRHDYSVTLPSSKVAAIELKGCLDGNNTNISERPPHADEFVVWSVCQNKGADPRHNLWSGVHVRFSADIIAEEKRVDGLIVWDWLCNTAARKCPKVANRKDRLVEVGPYQLPPPCIYTFPATITSPRNNPNPPTRDVSDIGFLDAMHRCFGGEDSEINQVEFEAAMAGVDLVRTTTIWRDGTVRRKSKPTPIRRS
ncbi:MAG: hypothetical protein GYB36_12905 [Alphaproteobacteria bacterium]|nr:hypothetical protein [Alphaproteobacteria bacterium]